MKISVKSSSNHGKNESKNDNRKTVDTPAEVLRKSKDDDDGSDSDTNEKHKEHLREE